MMLKNFLFIFILMLLVAGCGEYAEKSKTDNNSELTSVEQQTSAASGENSLKLGDVAFLNDVTLFSNKKSEDGGVFKGITVRTWDKSKTFPWVNLTNPTYYPKVNVVDVDGDIKEEIVIFLTKGSGTSTYLQEIHVLNKEDLTEIMVENPLDAINKRVNSRITENNDKVYVVVEWDGQKIEKIYNKSDAGVWNGNVGFGRIVKYQLLGENIYAIVPGFASVGGLTVVEAIIKYDSSLKAEIIAVKDMDEGGWPDWPDVIKD